MKKLRYWLSILPAGLALKLRLLRSFKKLLGIPFDIYYSQTGEDIIIGNYYDGIDKGYYIDAGCHDPIRLSNTFKLYTKGWTGINIDADSEIIKKANRIRKKDINICAAVSDSIKTVTFYKSATTPNVSTINPTTKEEWSQRWEFDEKDQVVMTTTTLTHILDEYLPAGQKIDLLNVDVEGQDTEVLKGLNFQKYRPRLIVTECHDLEKVFDNEIYQHLVANQYRLIGFATMNVYFEDTRA